MLKPGLTTRSPSGTAKSPLKGNGNSSGSRKASPLLISKTADLTGSGSNGIHGNSTSDQKQAKLTNISSSSYPPLGSLNGFSSGKSDQDTSKGTQPTSRLSISPFLLAQNRQDLLGSILNFPDTNASLSTAGTVHNAKGVTSSSTMDPPRKLLDGNFPYARNSISNYLYYDNGNPRASIFLPPISQLAGSGNTSGTGTTSAGGSSNQVPNSRSNSIFSSLIQIPGSASNSISGASSAMNTLGKPSTSAAPNSQQIPLPLQEIQPQQLATSGQPALDVSIEDLEYLLNNRESLSGLFSFQSPDRSNSLDGSFWDIQLPQQTLQQQPTQPQQQLQPLLHQQHSQHQFQQPAMQQQGSNSGRPSSGSSLGDIIAFLSQGSIDYAAMTDDQRRELILKLMNDPAIRKSISIAKQKQQGFSSLPTTGGQFSQYPQQHMVMNGAPNHHVPHTTAKLREDIFKSDKLSPGSRLNGNFETGKTLEQDRYSPTSSLSSKSAGAPHQLIPHPDDPHSPKTSPSGSSGVISGRPSIDLSSNMPFRFYPHSQMPVTAQVQQSPTSNTSKPLSNPYAIKNQYSQQPFGYQQLPLQMQSQGQFPPLMMPLNPPQQIQLGQQQLDNIDQVSSQGGYGTATSGVTQSPVSIKSEPESIKLTHKRQKRSRKKNSVSSASKTPTTISPPLIIGSNTSTDPNLLPAQQIAKLEDGRPLLGATKIDQLMLVIQARDKGVTNSIQQAPDGSILTSMDKLNSILPTPMSLVGGVMKPQHEENGKDEKDLKKKKEKTQKCPYCLKFFTHTTHLEVHIRSHIGYKPYECSYCHKKFTQGGNLRTHLRLHTGEKPFKCDICQRSFSRKGNLEAHKLTHEHLKPFECKLDGCDKFFTQLGNLKSHQNKFHLDTLTRLTHKLAELSGPALENLPQSEKDLLMYFKGLYKNSNRGIRGRGKKVADDKSTPNANMGANLSPSFVNPQISPTQPVPHQMLAPPSNAPMVAATATGGPAPFQPRVMLPQQQQQETQQQGNSSQQQLPQMLMMMNNMNNMLDNTGIFQN